MGVSTGPEAVNHWPSGTEDSLNSGYTTLTSPGATSPSRNLLELKIPESNSSYISTEAVQIRPSAYSGVMEGANFVPAPSTQAAILCVEPVTFMREMV